MQSAKPKVQRKGTKTVQRRQCMQKKKYKGILTKITNWYKTKGEGIQYW